MSCPLKDMQSEFNSDLKKPVLIISQPICVESLIISSLGNNPPFSTFDPNNREVQINGLKNHLKNYILCGCNEAEYYQDKLTYDILEERRKTVKELDLLIRMITK